MMDIVVIKFQLYAFIKILSRYGRPIKDPSETNWRPDQHVRLVTKISDWRLTCLIRDQYA